MELKRNIFILTEKGVLTKIEVSGLPQSDDDAISYLSHTKTICVAGKNITVQPDDVFIEKDFNDKIPLIEHDYEFFRVLGENESNFIVKSIESKSGALSTKVLLANDSLLKRYSTE